MNSLQLDQVENHIQKNYIILKFLGQGSYGKVWLALDLVTNEKVAIKKIREAFQNKKDAQRTFREVCFLYQLNNHDNIIRLRKVMQSKKNMDLYLIFDYMETDLFQLIRNNDMKLIRVQYVTYQILVALKYIHSGRLIHRDIKPSNILADLDLRIKLSDFGLARCIEDLDENSVVQTENIATKSYRAPEIMFGSKNYSNKIDIWSLGCTVWEMLNKKILFDAISQESLIFQMFDILGIPTNQDILSFKLESPDSLENLISTNRYRHAVNYSKKLQVQDPQAFDFIKRCLKYNPNERMTADEALKHPFVKQFQAKQNKKLSSNNSTTSAARFITLKNDNIQYSSKEYKDVLLQFINSNQNDIQQYKKQQEQSRNRRASENGLSINEHQINKYNMQISEEKNHKFHSPKASLQTLFMKSEKNLLFQCNQKLHRRLSIQTDFSQQYTTQTPSIQSPLMQSPQMQSPNISKPLFTQNKQNH